MEELKDKYRIIWDQDYNIILSGVFKKGSTTSYNDDQYSGEDYKYESWYDKKLEEIKNKQKG